MARFEVFAGTGTAGLLLDCQANLLKTLNTRFVVPLLPAGDAPVPARHLNPVFEIRGQSYVMVTQFAAAIPVRELGLLLASLADHDTAITAALDMLTCGI